MLLSMVLGGSHRVVVVTLAKELDTGADRVLPL